MIVFCVLYAKYLGCLPFGLQSCFREGIKGFKLRRCSKLNSTHPGELWQPQFVHCGSYKFEG